MTDGAILALAEAFRTGGLVDPLPEALIVDAATVRASAAAARAAVGWPQVGWKIGATSAELRAIIGTTEPFFGPLFQPRLAQDGATVPLPAGFLGFECELALRLGADLPEKTGGYTAGTLAIAVDAVVLAIELVATRQRLPSMADPRRAAVDFGLDHGLVLGPVLAPPPLERLAEVQVVASVDGADVGRGSGRDVLGHPLEALAWLTRQGVPLRAGDLVSTGTCTGISALAPGQEARARFVDGDRVWGEVRFRAGPGARPAP